MSLEDQTVFRVYECGDCGLVIKVEQGVFDDFIKYCPDCNSNDFIRVQSKLGLMCDVDQNKPKTLGALAEKNYEHYKKTNPDKVASKKKIKPWWRKSEKINYDILKDPKRYIKDGRV